MIVGTEPGSLMPPPGLFPEPGGLKNTWFCCSLKPPAVNPLPGPACGSLTAGASKRLIDAVIFQIVWRMLAGIGPGGEGGSWLPSGSVGKIVVAWLGSSSTLSPRELLTVIEPLASATVVKPSSPMTHSRLVPRMPIVATGGLVG